MLWTKRTAWTLWTQWTLWKGLFPGCVHKVHKVHTVHSVHERHVDQVTGVRAYTACFLFCLFALLPAIPVQAEAPAPEDVVFTAKSDASQQHYVVVLPTGYKDTDPHDVLIALHGHGSDRWQFVQNARDECRAARDAAAKHKMIFVSPDYRATTSWMGPRAESDMVQIIGDLKLRSAWER